MDFIILTLLWVVIGVLSGYILIVLVDTCWKWYEVCKLHKPNHPTLVSGNLAAWLLVILAAWLLVILALFVVACLV